MAETNHVLPRGTVLSGKYTVDKVLGTGGFGITYLVTTYLGNIRVKLAMKEFFMADLCDRSSSAVVYSQASKMTFEAGKKTFMAEALRLQKQHISHPNIVGINEVWEENGTAYYVMEFIEGHDLRQYVSKTHGSLSEDEAKRLMAPVLSAIALLHANKITHLDIKPDNIMLSPEGDRLKPIVIDLGLSKHYDNEGRVTSVFQYVGASTGYAPIEQVDGALDEFTPQADVYALGATLYYMLRGEDPISSLQMALEPEYISDHLKGIASDKTIAAICKAMHPKAQMRTPSIEAFASDLGIDLKSAPDMTIIQLSPDHNLTKKKNPVTKIDDGSIVKKKKNWWIYTAIAAAAVAIFAIVFFTTFIHGNKAATTEPEAKPIAIDAQKTDTPESPVAQTSGKPEAMEIVVKGQTLRLLPVEGGTFIMGATDKLADGAWKDEKPTHQVTVADFMIGETEVTQELWQAIMGNNPSKFRGANMPAEGMTWDDCQTFIRKLNNLTGLNFSLPTEAEWEYAAKGGKQARDYLYSSSDNLDDVAWHKDNALGKTHPVATKQPNELGLYDMTGNVWEWCTDWYDKYSSPAQDNPTGPSTGKYRLLRGGSYRGDSRFSRISSRNYCRPDLGSSSIGLRLVLRPGS